MSQNMYLLHNSLYYSSAVITQLMWTALAVETRVFSVG